MSVFDRPLRRLTACCVLLLVVLWNPQPATAQDEIEELLDQVEDLFDDTELELLVTPIPRSRSVILVVNGASDFFLYLERGSIRGDAIDTFYQQLEAGETDAAYSTFQQHSLVSVRISDYGWNGLGVPMITPTGNEIGDVYFRVVEGVFRQAEITDEAKQDYVVMLRDVLIPALQAAAAGS